MANNFKSFPQLQQKLKPITITLKIYQEGTKQTIGFESDSPVNSLFVIDLCTTLIKNNVEQMVKQAANAAVQHPMNQKHQFTPDKLEGSIQSLSNRCAICNLPEDDWRHSTDGKKEVN